jgi:hypothetical protein
MSNSQVKSGSGPYRPKRGAKATPRHLLAAALPYRVGAASAAAGPASFIRLPAQVSMWGNYDHGDCVTAEEAFAKACNTPEIFISDDTVISWATAHNVLEGAYLSDVLTWMQTGGFTQTGQTYDDGSILAVDWKNAALLCQAIWEGPVKIGVAADQLETTWRAVGGNQNGARNGWLAAGYQPDANEDHCVGLCGYGTLQWLAGQLGSTLPAGANGANPGYAVFTWGSIGIIDVPSMLAITSEAWLRNPTTVIH